MPGASGSRVLSELGCDIGEHIGKPRGPVHTAEAGRVSRPASMSRSSCEVKEMP